MTKNKGVFTSDTSLEELVSLAFTRIRKKVDTTGAELGTDSTIAGYHFSGQVQNPSLNGTSYLEFFDNINKLATTAKQT